MENNSTGGFRAATLGFSAESCRANHEEVFRVWEKLKMFNEEDIDFQKRVLANSGLAKDGTYLPNNIYPGVCGDQVRCDLTAAMAECKLTLTGALQGLLDRTGLKATDIDILVTTCSIYCPTPSMASMLVNHFKMRMDVQSYHLGGMGCANGVVGMNLVRDLLQAHPNAKAVFCTTEVTTPAYYPGKDRHKLVPNLLFRMGAAAMLLSNNPVPCRHPAKYVLQHHERVHVGQSDEAYQAIRYSPDDQGINGIYLGKNVVEQASRGLTKALKSIGPKVLSIREKAKYMSAEVSCCLGWLKLHYFPTFSGSLDHFLIHAGGAKVLDGLGLSLRLTERDLEPSRAVLHNYGNVSSSTTWCTMSYVESMRGVRRGDRIMQIGVGSGVKCGINVWRALCSIDDVHGIWQHRATPKVKKQAGTGPGLGYLLCCLLLLLLVMAFVLLALPNFWLR